MFLNIYIPAGIEFATELTYPSTESTTTGILYAMSQVLGFLATLVLSIVTETYGTLWALSIIMVTMIVGALMTFIIPNKLRRQACLKAKVPNGFSSVPQDDILKS